MSESTHCEDLLYAYTSMCIHIKYYTYIAQHIDSTASLLLSDFQQVITSLHKHV